MEDDIRRRLRTIEQTYNLRILYACESGSRAWGFPSPDSDYDVRFIYIRPLSWYLSIDEKKDSLVLPLTADRLDFSGWDIRKALRLFRRSNGPLLEWLHSPITYLADRSFLEPVRQLEATFLSPRRLVLHYLGLAQSVWESARAQEQLPVKELLYMIRALLAAHWTSEQKGMPPVAIQQLASLLSDDRQTQGALHRLLEFKSMHSENAQQPVPESWQLFFRSEVQFCRERLGQLSRPGSDATALDRLFQRLLEEEG